MNERPTILLADDHGIFVAGLRHILEPKYKVLEAVSNGQDLVDAAERLRPDLVIADISMPVLNGIDAVRQVMKIWPRAKVLFLTMHPDVTYACEAIEAGALGYALKHSVTEELLEAVSRVLAGKRYISAPLAARVEYALAELNSGRRRKMAVELTPRQREVLQLIAEGRAAKDIADILCISPRTADFHKQEIRKLLGARSTAELVQHAIKLRLVDPQRR